MKVSVIFNNEKQSLETEKMEFKAKENTSAIAYALTYAIAEARALMISNGGKCAFNFSRRFTIDVRIGRTIHKMPMSNQIDFSKTFRASESKDKDGNVRMTKAQCFEKCANAIYADIHKIVSKARKESQVITIESASSVKFLGA